MHGDRRLAEAEAEAQREKKEAQGLLPRLEKKKQELSPLEKEVNDANRQV